ncbi:hypothetical protein [Nesterenkonia sp. CF4.4]|uniref:hypothetical protein n=1 Tax=Nesterenkonia sp. CF4.4 TaxID=3373079 RepID=UPI003EE7B1CD
MALQISIRLDDLIDAMGVTARHHTPVLEGIQDLPAPPEQRELTLKVQQTEGTQA